MSITELRMMARSMNDSRLMELLEFSFNTMMEVITQEMFDPSTTPDRLVTLQHHGSAILKVHDYLKTLSSLDEVDDKVLQSFINQSGIDLTSADTDFNEESSDGN